MEKVKCGDCKHWDRENTTKVRTTHVLIAQTVGACLEGGSILMCPELEHDCGDFKSVEPEVYEVECEWVGDIKGAIAVPDDLEPNDIHKPMWKRLVGKRTKLTIEVLD